MYWFSRTTRCSLPWVSRSSPDRGQPCGAWASCAAGTVLRSSLACLLGTDLPKLSITTGDSGEVRLAMSCPRLAASVLKQGPAWSCLQGRLCFPPAFDCHSRACLACHSQTSSLNLLGLSSAKQLQALDASFGVPKPRFPRGPSVACRLASVSCAEHP